jgi:putative transposase
VTRFRADTDQASRWMAFSLLEVEKGFRRVAGHNDLGALMKALERPSVFNAVPSETMTG